MHTQSMEIMDRLLSTMDGAALRVLDVGSYDVNGSYRALVERRGWTYVGLDIRSGTNVDVVCERHNDFPFEAMSFDIVMCGNMLHNVAEPRDLLEEMVRVVKRGGRVFVVAPGPNGTPYPNKHASDYWRFTPEGLCQLVRWAYVTDVQAEMIGTDVALNCTRL